MIARLFAWGQRRRRQLVAGATPVGAAPDREVTFVPCARVADLHPGEVRHVRVRGGREVVLALVGDKIWAVEAYCPHQRWPFKWSDLDPDGGRAPHLLCGRHGWRFCMDTGAVIDPPSFDRMEVYAVRVEGEAVLVGLPGAI